jgi:hypothetical protein
MAAAMAASADERVQKPFPAPSSIAKELTPETWQACYEACQKGFAQLEKILARVSPDIVVIIGDDQERVAAWAYGEQKARYPVATDLGKHLIQCLIDAEFDVAYSRLLKPVRGTGHAFSFVYGRTIHGNRSRPSPLGCTPIIPPSGDAQALL